MTNLRKLVESGAGAHAAAPLPHRAPRSLKLFSAAVIGLTLLVACGTDSEEPSETTPEATVDTVAPEETETTPEETTAEEPEDEETTTEESEDAQPDEESPSPTPEPDTEDSGRQDGGTFTAPTLSGGAEVSLTAPEGWELYGVEESITDFDLITAIRGGDGAPLQTVNVTDQELGVDATGVFDAMYGSYEDNPDTYSDLMALDPITIDGVEFLGLQATAHMSTGPAAVQYWFGDVGGTVLGIYLHHGDGGEMPGELTDIRDSLTFE